LLVSLRLERVEMLSLPLRNATRLVRAVVAHTGTIVVAVANAVMAVVVLAVHGRLPPQ
jgi:hypothetical protein